MNALTPTADLKAATHLQPKETPKGPTTVVTLFPARKSVVATRLTASVLAEIFQIPADNKALQKQQLGRQTALLNAVSAFSAKPAQNNPTTTPVWDLPQQPMQMQQQHGAVSNMSDEDRTALQQKQLSAQKRELALALNK